jgi:hypothetical protein
MIMSKNAAIEPVNLLMIMKWADRPLDVGPATGRVSQNPPRLPGTLRA